MNKEEVFPVFRVDTCWNSYAINYDLVCAKSKEDLLNHINEIWPPYEIIVNEGEEDCYPGYNPGDLMIDPYFNEDQLKELPGRIEEIPNLYSDTLYKIIDGYSYME